jgi:hypothetical protein
VITKEVRDSFGRVVERQGTFIVDVPLEDIGEDGTVELPDGTIVRITHGEATDG